MTAYFRVGAPFARRTFLRTSITGLSAFMLGAGCASDSPTEFDPEQLPDTALDLDALLMAYFEGEHLDDVASLGRGYLRVHEGTAEALQQRVAETLEQVAHVTSLPDAAVELHGMVEADFEQLTMSSLYGWQLARTELDLCIAASLIV